MRSITANWSKSEQKGGDSKLSSEILRILRFKRWRRKVEVCMKYPTSQLFGIRKAFGFRPSDYLRWRHLSKILILTSNGTRSIGRSGSSDAHQSVS